MQQIISAGDKMSEWLYDCISCGKKIPPHEYGSNGGLCNECKSKKTKQKGKQTDLVKDYGFPDFKKKELKFGKNE